MNADTVANLKEIARLTGTKCGQCVTPSRHRCCDAYFCGLAREEMRALGVHVNQIEDAELPYMGPFGCILPPEYRPGCTVFVCPPHLADKTFRRKYLSLLEDLRKDPDLMSVLRKTTGLGKLILDETNAFFKKAMRDLGILPD